MKKIFSWFANVFNSESNRLERGNGTDKGIVTGATNLDVNFPVTGIEWIDNDGLLRDEGVLFGIAEVDTSDKITAIRNGFDKAKAQYEVISKQLLDKLKDIHGQKEENLKSIANTKIEILELRANKLGSDTKVFPTIVQLITYGLISYLNYYLLSFWLKAVFDNYLIPLGIYSFGMLSVFIGKALLYNSNATVQQADEQNNKREKWKIWMEEFGVPLVVAAFIILITVRVYPAEWSIGGFILFFFLFSFAGKGLINSIYRCNYEIKQLRLYFGKVITRIRELKSKRNLLKKYEFAGEELEASAKRLVSERAEPDTKLTQLAALLDYKINIFESEYKHSSNAVNDLTAKQRASFQI
jgi:hypothetical protein